MIVWVFSSQTRLIRTSHRKAMPPWWTITTQAAKALRAQLLVITHSLRPVNKPDRRTRRRGWTPSNSKDRTSEGGVILSHQLRCSPIMLLLKVRLWLSSLWGTHQQLKSYQARACSSSMILRVHLRCLNNCPSIFLSRFRNNFSSKSHSRSKATCRCKVKTKTKFKTSTRIITRWWWRIIKITRWKKIRDNSNSPKMSSKAFRSYRSSSSSSRYISSRFSSSSSNCLSNSQKQVPTSNNWSTSCRVC